MANLHFNLMLIITISNIDTKQAPIQMVIQRERTVFFVESDKTYVWFSFFRKRVGTNSTIILKLNDNGVIIFLHQFQSRLES